MPLFAFEGRSPKVDPTAFIAPTAVLVGDVTVEAGASVWFNAVLRADYAPIVIREGAKPAVEAMGRCLADVMRREEESDPLVALSAEDIDRLVNWDAEKYRQTLKVN